GHTGRRSVAPASETVRVNRGGTVLAADLATCAGPAVVLCMFWVEVLPCRGDGHRFADHDLSWLRGATRRRRSGGAAAEAKYQTGAEPDSAESLVPQVTLGRVYNIKVLAPYLVVSFEEANAERLINWNVKPAAQNCA